MSIIPGIWSLKIFASKSIVAIEKRYKEKTKDVINISTMKASAAPILVRVEAGFRCFHSFERTIAIRFKKT